MRMLHKKISVIVIVVLVCFGVISAQEVFSPTEGTWANYQSLVLNLSDGAEAYYSFTGENPLESGFAYDGPVLLELEGDVTIDIAIVSSNSASKLLSIDYTVDLQETPSYIPPTESNSLLKVNDSAIISIPENVKFSLGANGVFHNGEDLKISGNMTFERNLLLTVQDGEVPFRYVLQLGETKNNNEVDTVDSAITVTNWNNITFLEEAPIVFSIDGEPLRQTNSGTIFVDRTQDRTIKWQKFEGKLTENFNTITLPKRPEVIGVPKNPIVNAGVTLSLSDSRYKFSTQEGSEALTSVYFIDTLSNDAFGFSEEIDIVYEGVTHGSVQATFVIDKVAPVAPIIVASDLTGYSRNDVQIDIQASDSVYYYIPEPIASKQGFSSDEYLAHFNSDFIDKTLYTLLEDTTISFKNKSGLALSYAVYAFTKDNAGNTSAVTQYQTVIDPYNFYIKQNNTSNNYNELGTVDRPYSSFAQLSEVLDNDYFKNVYVDGVFSNLESIELTQDISLHLTNNTRLRFLSGELITINNASVSISGGNIEQTNPKSLQSTLISASNSTLAITDTEFLLSGGINSNCIVLENSSVQMIDSGLTVQSEAYGAGIKANNSVILSQNSRYVIVSDTTVGMSLIGSSAQINNSSFTGIGPRSRALEFLDSNYSVVNNTFMYASAEELSKEANAAIWKDSTSVQNSLVDNTFDGFTTLIVN